MISAVTPFRLGELMQELKAALLFNNARLVGLFAERPETYGTMTVRVTQTDEPIDLTPPRMRQREEILPAELREG